VVRFAVHEHFAVVHVLAPQRAQHGPLVVAKGSGHVRVQQARRRPLVRLAREVARGHLRGGAVPVDRANVAVDHHDRLVDRVEDRLEHVHALALGLRRALQLRERPRQRQHQRDLRGHDRRERALIVGRRRVDAEHHRPDRLLAVAHRRDQHLSRQRDAKQLCDRALVRLPLVEASLEAPRRRRERAAQRRIAQAHAAMRPRAARLSREHHAPLDAPGVEARRERRLDRRVRVAVVRERPR
jgi:hypothetical protein